MDCKYFTNTNCFNIHSSENHCIKTSFQAIKSVVHKLFFSILRPNSCILHHLASLITHQSSIIHRAKTNFQQSKRHLFRLFLPLKIELLYQKQKIKPPHKVKNYAFRGAFCTILACVLHHFSLRFAAFYLAFCCIQPYVLLLNGVLFAAKRTFLGEKRLRFCISHIYIQCKCNFQTFTNQPLFHLNKPSRESNICEQQSYW